MLRTHSRKTAGWLCALRSNDSAFRLAARTRHLPFIIRAKRSGSYLRIGGGCQNEKPWMVYRMPLGTALPYKMNRNEAALADWDLPLGLCCLSAATLCGVRFLLACSKSLMETILRHIRRRVRLLPSWRRKATPGRRTA